ncbi:MAG TPA: ketoacyl-ACP synthase III [Blastocatellia bacterium]|nr:ketoacyl-ACP synthase III [Blastocatellia bacterium]
MSCYIIACGAALPERIVTNAELAPKLGVAPEWIEANSGIRARRWVEAHQSASDLATAAVRDALAQANLTADAIDYLIGGTLSPDYQVPGIAPLVQRKLTGCRQIPALDVRVGCAALLYSLQIARGLIATQAASTVVCFGAEAQSKGLDLTPRAAELSMLFGDGAGAVVVRDQPTGEVVLRVDDVLLATDGSFAEDLGVRAPGTGNGAHWREADPALFLPNMNGRTVILHAVRKLTEAALALLDRHQLSLGQIDWIVPHQANLHLLRALGKKLEVREDRIIVNLGRYGNTSGASAFLALHDARPWLQPGQRVLVLAFGAGFTWGAALLTAS